MKYRVILGLAAVFSIAFIIVGLYIAKLFMFILTVVEVYKQWPFDFYSFVRLLLLHSFL